MRFRYASDSYESNKARRLRRVAGRSTPELKQVYENGQISLRQFDIISKLPPAKQRRLIAAEKARSAAALIAAQTINQFLDDLGTGTPLRLSDVTQQIAACVRLAEYPRNHSRMAQERSEPFGSISIAEL
jgi:hypothetical protein